MQKPVFYVDYDLSGWTFNCPMDTEYYECPAPPDDRFYETEDEAWEALDIHIDKWHNR